ncbi:MAG: helix-turn-helix transcriptional regulator [Planctomycetota bacterium]|nr:MAG: helix-turn-helix transcriptional regulator [Planctomycetota bacterium]
MYQPSQPENKDKTRGLSLRDSFYTQPHVILLTEQHWAYIQSLYHMSPREVQVAQLVCQGLNNEDIARDLRIKRGTVKTHLRNIYRRVHVQNKITMLLRLLDQAAKLSAKSASVPPLSIVDIHAQKPPYYNSNP